MTRRELFYTLACVALGLIAVAGFALRSQGQPFPLLSLAAGDRILILSPHPDDDCIGCAGVMQQAMAAQIPVRVVYLTNGEAFSVYEKHPVLPGREAIDTGVVREGEALAACSTLGVSERSITFLGYPDYCVDRIWLSHWGGAPPCESPLTMATSVPYKNAFRFGAPFKGEDVLADLTSIIEDYRPTKVFVSHPADRTGDHWALYLFTRVALWDLSDRMNPSLYPFLVHFDRWPLPRGLHPTLPLIPPPGLASSTPWAVLPLTRAQVETKVRALSSHRTQMSYSRTSLLSLARANELFGEPSEVALAGMGAVDIGVPVPAATGKKLAAAGVDDGPYVDFTKRSVALDGGRLTLTVDLSKALSRDVEASIYFLGYRRDVPFGRMPKIHVLVSPSGYSIYDQQNELPSGAAEVVREATRLTVRIPLGLLNDPEKVLTNARTHVGQVSLDCGQWITLDLRDPATPAAPSLVPSIESTGASLASH